MTTPIVFHVPPEAQKQRIDVFLIQALAQLQHTFSRAHLQKLIEQQHVQVNARVVAASYRLKANDIVHVTIPPPVPLALEPVALPLDILFEDEHIIVLNKPAGLAVHPGAGPPKTTLVHALLAHCSDLSGIGGVQRPGIVHRLDAGTSGVMLIAKHNAAHLHLAQQFAQRRIYKEYATIVIGAPKKLQFQADTFYQRHPTQRKKFSSLGTSGKKAKTSFCALFQGGGLTALRALLHTGRTHQIRVHLADLKLPILQDPLYGPKQTRLSFSPLQTLIQQLHHQALHAHIIQCLHPISLQPLQFVAPLPPLFLLIHQQMKLAPNAILFPPCDLKP